MVRRGLILLGFFAMAAVAAGAAERITVAQLEQQLASPPEAKKAPAQEKDSIGETDLLRQMQQQEIAIPDFDRLELSERLTRLTLARLIARYKLGAQMRKTLQEMADRSALLDPPESEMVKMLPPDADTQKRMVTAARVYVVQTLSHLPNFFAIRTTFQFNNAPPSVYWMGVQGPIAMHQVGSTAREITFHDGKEVMNAVPGEAKDQTAQKPMEGLESSGEFGPEPAIVLLDLVNGVVTFRYWEQMPVGLAAVYRYEVPPAASHYQVNYSCKANELFHESPGYHGSLAIDPASGAILRITLEVDGKKNDPISHVASVIEYGPVVLGQQRYICPERSLAFMVEDADACARRPRDRKLDQPVTMLNRTIFSDYHRLGTTIKIVPDTSGTAPPATTVPSPPPDVTPVPNPQNLQNPPAGPPLPGAER